MKTLLVASVTAVVILSGCTASAPAAPAGPPPPSANAGIPQSVVEGAFVLGDPAAPVTIEEYADYQCTSCGQFTRTILPALRTTYVETGKAKIVWRDFPWIGEESRLAAQAARCAGAQSRFWDYHDYLYANQRGENQGTFSAGNLKKFAKAVGLDDLAFGQCLDAGKDLPALREEARNVAAKGFRGTPSFTINGKPLVSGTLEQFARAIDSQLPRG
jgi:protein-disulfide isomerase